MKLDLSRVILRYKNETFVCCIYATFFVSFVTRNTKALKNLREIVFAMTPKKIVQMVRKWRSEAQQSDANKRYDYVTNKGHFVVYAADQSRFVMPLHYLNSNIFLELLRISEDEFGLPRNGPITLPCDSILMNYLINVLERGLSDDFEKALLAFIVPMIPHV